MRHPAGLMGTLLCLMAPAVLAAPPDIEGYLKPYVDTNNFSGTVVVTEKGQTLFAKSYGFADRENHVLNGSDTRYHIASMSILFTAFATLRLVEEDKLSLDDTAGSIVGPLPNGDRITVRELLEEDSGLPDFNDLRNYDALIAVHQTPASVVDQIRRLPPRTEPGGKSQMEEHSACNVLALIIEKKTGLPYAEAMQKLVFGPAGMKDSGADDDRPIGGKLALGYRPDGEFGMKRAPTFHWSAKPGNGSDYSTADDISRWFAEFMGDKLLSAKTRALILGGDKTEVGFGWEGGFDRRFGEDSYLASGRAPGFSSVMFYLPKEELTVLVLNNIEHESNYSIAVDITDMVLGKPHGSFDYHPVTLTAEQRRQFTGRFQFGPDFYRSNGVLEIKDSPQGLLLEWPGGPEAPLLPMGAGTFMDRYYWIPATVTLDAAGHPTQLKFGKFLGSAMPLHGG